MTFSFQFEYLVKWQGFPSSSNTWEPAYNFLSAETIREYHEKKELRRVKKKEKRRESVSDESKLLLHLYSNQCKLKQFDICTQVPNDNKSSDDSSIMDGKRLPYHPEKVLNIYQNDKGELITLIKFKGRPKASFVPAEWANVHCPELVIAFYENRIYWTIDGETLTKHVNNQNTMANLAN